MKYLLLLGVFCTMLGRKPRVPDSWVIIDTVGIVNFVIEQDTENRNAKQLDVVYKKVRQIAMELDSVAREEKSFKRISMYEGGKNGEVRLIPHYDSERDTCHMERLFIALPDSLFQEEIVFRLYEYSKTIPFYIYYNHPDLLMGTTILERAGVLPATE